MSIIEEYARQFKWRSWETVLDALPDLNGTLVLDLGCGVGDLSAELSERGARVVGIDMNPDLIAHANSRRIPRANFQVADLRNFCEPNISADGIWSSFTMAYFPADTAVVSQWLKHLKPGGWLALTEIDDLFAHEPLPDRTQALLESYVSDSLALSRYDFRMGHKMRSALESVGVHIDHEFCLPDSEFCFSGPASAEVVVAWKSRLDRMRLLQELCGNEFETVLEDFLDCLQRVDHQSQATVRCCIARKSP